MNDDHSLSIWLSDQMKRVGFRSPNAKIQSAMASVLQDVLRFLLLSEDLYVFGSYSDGWGSCLDKLDGSIEPSSDIDVTIMSGKRPIHPVSGLSGDLSCPTDQIAAEYSNGHIFFRSGEKPNFDVKKSDLGMVDAFDIIVAIPCSSYPRIELLQDGYKTRTGQESNMPITIMNLLREEVFGDSPRCHAVAASPPNLPAGSCMRVSTTLLERTIMQNLTDVQGQFFIIMKFLIKKVMSERTAGLKTYIAKNLLFYMLDETPEDHWSQANLISLVRTALEMLIEMMDKEESDNVCMKHFFLRDANVYFKKNQHPKSAISATIRQIAVDLNKEIERFSGTLAEETVDVVQFHAFFSFHLVAEVICVTDSPDMVIQAFREVRDTHKAVSESYAEISSDEHLEKLLLQISQLPDCVRVSRDWLRALAHFRVGKSLAGEAVEYRISHGVKCPQEGQNIKFKEVKAEILQMLQEPDPMRVQLQDGQIVGCTLEKELTPLASFVASMKQGNVPRVASLFNEMLQSSPLLPMVINYRRVEQPRAMAALLDLARHIRRIVGTESPVEQLTEDELD